MNLFNEEEPQENDIVRQISKHCKRLGNEADFNEKKQQLIIFNPLNDRRVVLNLKKDNFVQIISYNNNIELYKKTKVYNYEYLINILDFTL